MSSMDLVVARPRVARPALAERIREALAVGALMLLAEAGFGKTTALDEALLGWSGVAWITCHAADRDARRFVLRLIDALGRVVPGAGDVLAEQLAAQPQFDA